MKDRDERDTCIPLIGLWLVTSSYSYLLSSHISEKEGSTATGGHAPLLTTSQLCLTKDINF